MASHFDSPLRHRSRSSSPSPALLVPPRLVRSTSASSIAGDAAFASTLPPPPPSALRATSRPPSPEPGELPVEAEPDEEESLTPARVDVPLVKNSPLGAVRVLVRRARRQLRLAIFFLALFLSLFYLLSSLVTPTISLLTLVHFKLLDRAYDEQWGWPLAPTCSLRKRPLVFVRGSGTAAIVWETNDCESGTGWRLKWRKKGRKGRDEGDWQDAEVEVEEIERETEEHGGRVVYSAALVGLQPLEQYAYEVVHRSPSSAEAVVARSTFPWIGLSSSPASASTPTTLHLACVADNQFNLRIFSRVLSRLSSFGRSLPSSYFSSSPSSLPSRAPHLLLHAGDVVQNPHNLAQWQTDMWDPLTRPRLPLPFFSSPRATPPILLARGNHDWDSSGSNAYVGGLSGGASLRQDYHTYLRSLGLPLPTVRTQHRGTYYSFSPHARFRILVLDSNLPTEEEQAEQERWLRWELEREEWTGASVRAVAVHTAPWIEWWNRKAWTTGGESEWSSYVRRSLIPLLAQHYTTLVLSGHSHAYTRGFLPYSLVPSFASAANSTSLPPLAAAAVRARAWERTPAVQTSGGIVDESGMLLVTFGGAGGTLDEDRVEEWGFMEKSVKGRYHFGWMAASFAGSEGQEAGSAREVEKELKRKRGKGEAPRVYKAGRVRKCKREEKEVRDVVEWRAVGVEGGEVDRVFLVGEGCAS
ncbi:hypothetical protein JCM8097_001196 [Rhodosporidiobolus ruineniae]